MSTYASPADIEQQMDASIAAADWVDAMHVDQGSVYTEILGSGRTGSVNTAADATRRIIAAAQASRQPPDVPTLIPVDAEPPPDPVTHAFDLLVLGWNWPEIVGDEEPVPPAQRQVAAPTDSSGLPKLRNLYRRLTGSAQRPKLMRVDTPASYGDFVSRKAFKELITRVNDLRAAFEGHAGDGHGGKGKALPTWGEILGTMERVSQLRSTAALDNFPTVTEVPLSLPPFCHGNVRCWEEGGAICCSIRVEGPERQECILTAATPLEDHVQELLGYVADAGVDPIDVLGALPALARMFGGGGLIPQLAVAAPALLDDPETAEGRSFVRKAIPPANAPLAALMALMQLAQGGDPQAAAEWQKLARVARSPHGAPLASAMADAQGRMGRAKRKAKD